MHAKRYVLAGLAAGLLLVILASLVEGYLRFGGSLLEAQHASPLLWLVDTAPVVVAFLAWMVGRRQDEVLEVLASRAAAYTRTAGELQQAATALFQSVSAFSAMTADTAASVQETTETMSSLSQTAMRAALTAETVVGLAQKSARSSEEGLRALEATAAGLARLADGGAPGSAQLLARMREVVALTASMGKAAKDIATVAQQQDRGIEETLKAMNGIFLSVQEAVSQTAQVAAQARALSDLAAGLKGSIRPPA
ncbi:MAG: methyl-accepting chemotaxis protein [Deltaproteobacteria bacterium]|nr:methyl-accepting chemotaxis protein [Deltaproteobacteria bacterium]